ncbi:hypothetical protein M407DRAFT_197311 [Tulasnella calospora MUT 4182]|uniref:Dienelactone hydrolase domain-containing protein n=1 Tax=Tulasnella calospora MUT 4182 TaxID=1051891 RepID=A0A0C3KZF1_9AGAM|nr:hypothetical protein M407DRAFT_197311 [Tulasnella calospora MUT 4182]
MTSSACCSIPPVIIQGYEKKGDYSPYGGLEKAYITGPDPKDTGRAILVVYDVLGYSTQGLQGADILAQSVNARVVVPDFLRGSYFDLAWMKPDASPEDKERMQQFRADKANPIKYLEEVATVASSLKAAGAKKVALVGFCWGGKVATLTGTDPDVVDATVVIHPGAVDPQDAEGVAVPFAMYDSKDEDKEKCDAFMKALESKPFAAKNERKRYDTMHHGWAAARGNLENEENLKEFKDVFATMSAFLNRVLDSE